MRVAALTATSRTLLGGRARTPARRSNRRRAITRLLGAPDERGRRSPAWDVGPEFDSFFRVDDEYFEVRFDRHDRFRAASFYQG